MAGESLHTTAQDEVIKQQRAQLYPEIRTFTAAVLNSDSILQVTLGELQLNQRDGHLGVVEKTSRVVLNSFQQEFGFIKTQ